jgi:predicted dehydrogenase
VRIAVIGLGLVSRFYVAAAAKVPEVSLVAACDVDDDALAQFRGKMPCFRDHRQLLELPRLDAVVVTAPNDEHARICRDVLSAGLPVCVEKPLATSVDDARALVHAASSGVPLFTAFHRRYNTAVRTLAGRVRGLPVESVTVRYLERIEDHAGPDSWYGDPARCGGGCVADNGPNAFDLARMLLGDLRVEDASVERDGRGVDRRAKVALTSESGAVVDVELDWSYGGERKDVEVRLAGGTTLAANMLAGYSRFKGSLWHEYEGVLVDFALAVSSRHPRADGGLAATELVEATYRAERVYRAPLPRRAR